MTNYETRRYEMLKRVREFGEAHRELFQAETLGGRALEEVAAAVAQLGEHAVAKMSAQRGVTRGRATARSELRRRLDAISRNARVIAGDTPGFADPFCPPRQRSDQALVTAARLFIRESEAVKSRFIAYGMPDSFVATLGALVDGFEQAMRSGETKRDGHTAARASIEAALSGGIAAVRKLDVILANRLGDDPVTMAVWKRDRRIHAGRSRTEPLETSSEVSPALPAVSSGSTTPSAG